MFLSVTGAEALYADMGHFGRRPIRIAWFSLVLPALVVNYMGQGALLLSNPETREHPFFYLAPGWALLPLVALSTMATVIASQAVISGAFSLTQQAIQLGYSPRFNILHTSAHEKGQVYIPEVNWMLMIATVGLVFGFGTSTNLAAAYGMAVTTTMVITTLLAFFVARERWGWSAQSRRSWCRAPSSSSTSRSSAPTSSRSSMAGGSRCSSPALVYAVMTTWATGRQLVVRRLADSEVPLSQFFMSIAAKPPVRVPGTGIFMTARPEGAPPILVHHLTHNKVLHEHVVLLTVSIVDVPTVDPDDGDHGRSAGQRVLARGRASSASWKRPTCPSHSNGPVRSGLNWRLEDTTYYLAHLTLFTHPSGSSRHDGVARQAVRLPVAQRASRDQLLPDPSRPRGRDRHSARNLGRSLVLRP